MSAKLEPRGAWKPPRTEVGSPGGGQHRRKKERSKPGGAWARQWGPASTTCSVRPWTSASTSLGFSSLVCKTGPLQIPTYRPPANFKMCAPRVPVALGDGTASIPAASNPLCITGPCSKRFVPKAERDMCLAQAGSHHLQEARSSASRKSQTLCLLGTLRVFSNIGVPRPAPLLWIAENQHRLGFHSVPTCTHCLASSTGSSENLFQNPPTFPPSSPSGPAPIPAHLDKRSHPYPSLTLTTPVPHSRHQRAPMSTGGGSTLQGSPSPHPPGLPPPWREKPKSPSEPHGPE